MSKQVTDEQLSAYIDGELTADDAEIIKHAVNADPALAGRLAELESNDWRIVDAYSQLDDVPMPDEVMALLNVADSSSSQEYSDNVVEFPLLGNSGRKPLWSQTLAASVALIAGLGIGMLVANTDNETAQGLEIASVSTSGSELFNLLETLPSGHTAEISGTSVKPILSFRSESGSYCREFQQEDSARSSRAVACRAMNSWETQFVVFQASNAGKNAEFSTASSMEEQKFAELVTSRMVGDALSQEEEASMLGHWSR